MREELDAGLEESRLLLLVRLGRHRPHRVAELLQGGLKGIDEAERRSFFERSDGILSSM